MLACKPHIDETRKLGPSAKRKDAEENSRVAFFVMSSFFFVKKDGAF